MDSFASLALATDNPTDELLKRKPYGRTSNLVTKIMAKNILMQSVYQISVVMFLLFAGLVFSYFVVDKIDF
jgi:magnesium-transporting ATPase (P-type)